jgi:transposase
MKELPSLNGLSHAEKHALIGGLWQELQTLRSEVEKLKQKRVKKTSRNSSLPPSKGFSASDQHSLFSG